METIEYGTSPRCRKIFGCVLIFQPNICRVKTIYLLILKIQFNMFVVTIQMEKTIGSKCFTRKLIYILLFCKVDVQQGRNVEEQIETTHFQ